MSSGNFLRTVWELSGLCLGTVWNCLGAVWEVSGTCLETFWRRISVHGFPRKNPDSRSGILKRDAHGLKNGGSDARNPGRGFLRFPVLLSFFTVCLDDIEILQYYNPMIS